jgi:hypothetical protein
MTTEGLETEGRSSALSDLDLSGAGRVAGLAQVKWQSYGHEARRRAVPSGAAPRRHPWRS